MTNFKILDIKKMKANYEIFSLEKVKEKGHLSLEAKVERPEETEGENETMLISFKFSVGTSGEQEEQTELDLSAKLEVEYKVVVSKEGSSLQLTDTELLHFIEPYARREINDMLMEMNIPLGVIPYGVWKDAQQD